MPKFVGLTTEEAISKGLKEMNVTRDEVKITVVEEEKKGFLGIGKRGAVVQIERVIKEPITEEVTSKEEIQIEETLSEIAPAVEYTETEERDLEDNDAIKEVSLYLTEITKQMGIPAMVKVQKEHGVVVLNLENNKQGMLIGKHGKILNALQYLAQVFIHRVAKNKVSVIVNVGDYREKREQIVQSLAKNTAEKVKRTGEPVILEPMSAYERKQVHSILSNDPQIKTHSEGEEPYRYLIVEYQKTI